MYTVYCTTHSDGYQSWRRIASFADRSDAIVYSLLYRGPGLVRLIDGDRCVMYSEVTRKCSSEFRQFLVENVEYLRDYCHISDEFRESVLTNFKTI